jgi:hypothetical protein
MYGAGIALLFLLAACTSPVATSPLHIHPHLEIDILGVKQAIPAGIGLSPNNHSVIHTHEEDGTLHVESSVPRTFYLKEFFNIWGKKFDNQCIFEYCNDAEHELKVYVNGKEDTRFGDIVLEKDQNIRIVYLKNEHKYPTKNNS